MSYKQGPDLRSSSKLPVAMHAYKPIHAVPYALRTLDYFYVSSKKIEIYGVAVNSLHTS